jgi:CheY-like chemotaxis protein
MDDEMLVLDVAEEMLHELGFSVTRAMNGEELLELYQSAKKNEQKPKLVIMDLTIPGGMGGLETIKALRRLDPDIPAIVSSGYSNDKIMSNYQQYSFSGIVAKPYTLEDLQRAIDKALAPKIKQEA